MDPKLLQSWHRGELAQLGAAGVLPGKKTASKKPLNIRLGATVSGQDFSYAPTVLSSHNEAKRRFIPNVEGFDGGVSSDQTSETTLDAAPQTAQGAPSSQQPAPSPFTIGDDNDELAEANAALEHLELESGGQTQSAAAAYAAGINMDAPSVMYPGSVSEPLPTSSGDTASLNTTASRSSTKSSVTALQLSAAATGGFLPGVVRDGTVSSTFRAPPSVHVKGWEAYGAAQEPWKGVQRDTHRAFERPTEAERQGLVPNSFLENSAEGRPPGAHDAIARDLAQSSASLRSSKTSIAPSTRTNATKAGELRVLDIFDISQSADRPTRLVRRTDPRQILLCCAGSAVKASEAASMAAVKAAMDAGVPPAELRAQAEQRKNDKAWLERFGGAESTDIRAGVGVYLSPETAYEEEQTLLQVSMPAEANLSRRLERPTDLQTTTYRRAAVRAALAAIEYRQWENEGFDKIVIGVDDRWLVDGIASDIWEWRMNNWTLSRSGPLGDIGDEVPDRDLWEMLDQVVRDYEKIDCTCRFWHLPKGENESARQLALEGAMKDNQQPMTVRWRKTTFAAPGATASPKGKERAADFVADSEADSYGISSPEDKLTVSEVAKRMQMKKQGLI